ncbi:hypothetical protein D3C81_900450 [compost metagenome]
MKNNIEIVRARNNSIIETFLLNGGEVIDAATRRPVKLTHVARFGHEGEYETVVGLIDGKALNLCKIEFVNNKLVLTREAVGNKLNAENLPMPIRVELYKDWEDNKVWDLVPVIH